VDDDRFIAGIHNYCDRWCERCPLTARCRVYALEEEAHSADETNRDLTNAEFWEGLRDILRQTQQMIEQYAREQGIDLNAVEAEAVKNQRAQRRARAKASPLVRSAEHYITLVDRWFRAEAGAFEERANDLNTLIQLGLDKLHPEAEAAAITDALEVIRWYQYPIAVKLTRAVRGGEDFGDPDLAAHRQADADGSAKVALIAIDRSLAAWGRLREYFPDVGDSILDLLVHLDRLRRAVEKEYPNARAFVRPGFDTGDLPAS
jgi:hypothetical protein